jgi:hypothetical protein
MRRRKQIRRGSCAKRIAPRRFLSEEDDPLFEERDIVFAGAGDERVTPPER